MKSAILTIIFTLSLFSLQIIECKYPKDNLYYEDSSSLTEDGVSIVVRSMPEKRSMYCQEKVFKADLSLSLTLTDIEKNLISFIISEYIDYGVKIISQVDVVAGGFKVSDFNKLRERQFKYGQKVIESLGLDLEEVSYLSQKILNVVDKVHINSIEDFIKFYRYEKEKIAIISEYKQLFESYGMETYITKQLFNSMITIRKNYTSKLKKLFILSIANELEKGE